MGWIPKYEEKQHYCHKCKGELVFDVKMQRADTCPHCATDMHCCKNCEYWDPSAHNQCREHIAEYIPDREAANRCTFFTFRSGKPEDNANRVLASKAKLEDLFKKKGD
jgi:hypothetical protein